ncbi:MAG: 3'-5' exonuclease [Magnetococcales bacterium]|nr:3'-5' exonuclease [Magnetococcales bacterium]
MSWLGDLLDRLRGGLPAPSREAMKNPLGVRRMVVVDVETTGPDPASDHLLSIGAVVIRNLSIDCGNLIDVVLRQEKPSSRDNILFHGIGAEMQCQGTPPQEALQSFLEFVGDDPLIAFHAPFDQFMIDKALRLHLETRLANPWLDLSRIAPALYPEKARRLQSLDDWSRFFGIANIRRHHAVGDAFATAQLGLILFNTAMRQGNRHFGDLLALDRNQRWLSGRV